MKKLILTIIFLLIMNTAFAFNPMDVLTEEHDEQLHILTAKSINDWVIDNTDLNFFERYLLMEITGVTKESLDVMCGGNWDSDDQDANRVGFILSEFLKFEWEF